MVLQGKEEARPTRLNEEVEQAKREIKAMEITQEEYMRLANKPFAQLSLEEVARLRVHEKVQELPRAKEDQERERKKSSQLEQELSRVRSEVGAGEEAVNELRERAERAEAKCQRLEKELEDASLNVHVFSAKASLYDETASKCVRACLCACFAVAIAMTGGLRCLSRLQNERARIEELEKERDALQHSKQRAAEEAEKAQRQVSEKKEQVHLLEKDKEHLSREADSANERVRKSLKATV